MLPLGAFVDFVQVQTEISGTLQSGFVPKDSLANPPNDLPELGVNELPWMPTADALNLSGWSVFGDSIQNGVLVHHSVPNGWVTNADVLDPIQINGPFAVQVQFSGQGTDYGVLLFGTRNDNNPWWQGIRRLDLDSTNGDLALLLYDGASETPQYSKLPPYLKSGIITLQFDADGKNIAVLDSNGTVIQSVQWHTTLFPNKILYFGVNAGRGGTLQISKLARLEPPSGKSVVPQTEGTPANQAPALSDLAAKNGIELGSLGNRGRFSDPQYDQILSSNYNLYLSEDFHWGSGLRPDSQHYDFSAGDSVVAFAKRYGMRVQAHHLLWGFEYALPKWLLNGNYTRDQLLQLIHDHISTVVGHFKGRVNEWTVVNEAFGGNDQFWGPRIGPEYIELAFRWAHEADPKAALILNQYNDEDRRNQSNQTITDQTYNLIKDLKEKGVPIDGVGMQMHLSIDDPPKKEDVIQNMRHFGELGVSVYVTELDVNLYGASGTTEEKYARQAQVYRDMLGACLESGVCKSFTMFGFYDPDSWLLDPTVQRDLGLHGEAPLLFDANYSPKPAYFAIRDTLLGK